MINSAFFNAQQAMQGIPGQMQGPNQPSQPNDPQQAARAQAAIHALIAHLQGQSPQMTGLADGSMGQANNAVQSILPMLQHIAGQAYGQAGQLQNQAYGMTPPHPHGVTLAQGGLGVLLAALSRPQNNAAVPYLEGVQGQNAKADQSDMQQYQAKQQGLLGRAGVAQQQGQRADQMRAGVVGANQFQQEQETRRYVADQGYAGKVRPAELRAGSAETVAQIKRGGAQAQTAANMITNGSPAEKSTGYQILRSTIPALQGMSDEDLASAAQQLTPKQDAQEAGAKYNDTKAADLAATRAARIGLLTSKAGVNAQKAKELAETTRLMPDGMAVKVALAQAAADNAASLRDFRTGTLNQQAANQANMNLRAGMNTLHSQANNLRDKITMLQKQFNASTDPDVKRNISQQVKAYSADLDGYMQKYRDFSNVASQMPTAQTSQPTNVIPMPVTLPVGGLPLPAKGLNGRMPATPMPSGPIGPQGKQMAVDRQRGLQLMQQHPEKAAKIRQVFQNTYGVPLGG